MTASRKSPSSCSVNTGARLKDLVPTPGSLYALYGDTSRASSHVEQARHQIANGTLKTYSFRELTATLKRMDDGYATTPAKPHETWRRNLG